MTSTAAAQSPARMFAPGLFAGRVVVVTGGGSGIGRGICLEMAKLGASVVLAGRRQEKLEEVEAEIRSLGVQALSVVTNVREAGDVERLRDSVKARFGKVDFVVNNAGANFVSPAVAISPNGWKAVTETVLNGTFFGCRYFGEWMMDQGSGRIINMAATNGMVGSPLMAHSGAAKAGVINLTKTLATEWAQWKILVNAVAPGPVDTQGANQRLWASDDAMDVVRQAVPLRRLGSVDDCVYPVLFLCGPSGDFVTGQVICVDGGNSLPRVPAWFTGAP